MTMDSSNELGRRSHGREDPNEGRNRKVRCISSNVTGTRWPIKVFSECVYYVVFCLYIRFISLVAQFQVSASVKEIDAGGTDIDSESPPMRVSTQLISDQPDLYIGEVIGNEVIKTNWIFLSFSNFNFSSFSDVIYFRVLEIDGRIHRNEDRSSIVDIAKPFANACIILQGIPPEYSHGDAITVKGKLVDHYGR